MNIKRACSDKDVANTMYKLAKVFDCKVVEVPEKIAALAENYIHAHDLLFLSMQIVCKAGEIAANYEFIQKENQELLKKFPRSLANKVTCAMEEE